MGKEKPAIFISYRQADSGDFSGRLADRLKQRFGKRRVFLDIGGIEYGVDYAKTLRETLAKCHVLVTVIGKDWLRLLDERLGQEDWVLIENTTALERGVHVIPVRIGRAEMPKEQDLPEPIRKLRHFNGPVFDLDDFDADADKLIERIERILTEKGVKIPWSEQTRRRAIAMAAGALAVAVVPSVMLAFGSSVPPYLAVLGYTPRIQPRDDNALLLIKGRDTEEAEVEVRLPWKNRFQLYVLVHQRDEDKMTSAEWDEELDAQKTALEDALKSRMPPVGFVDDAVRSRVQYVVPDDFVFDPACEAIYEVAGRVFDEDLAFHIPE